MENRKRCCNIKKTTLRRKVCQKFEVLFFRWLFPPCSPVFVSLHTFFVHPNLFILISLFSVYFLNKYIYKFIPLTQETEEWAAKHTASVVVSSLVSYFSPRLFSNTLLLFNNIRNKKETIFNVNSHEK